LHFGLACQQARADGIENVDILPVCDDVSVARSKGALVGRRALAGTILGMSTYFIMCRIVLSFCVLFFQVSKFIGAASEADWSFDAVLKLGQAVTGAIASIASTLDHCHVSGRSEYSIIPPRTVEIGLGLHNGPVSNYFDYFTCICLDNPNF